MLVFLGGCTSVSPNAWRVAPIEFDNAMEGDREDLIDVSYPMAKITTDTAGGIWTESAGSWLHLDENGNTLRRFNAEMIMTVHGISAVSPSVLAVSRTDRENASGAGTGLFLYDTDAGTWDAVGVDAETTGDVVVDAAGRIVFVDFLGAVVPGAMGGSVNSDAPTPFAIRALDSSGRQTTVLEADPGLTATAVAIDTDSTGTVYVSTERETFSVGIDGTRTPISTHAGRQPVLAVSAGGDVLAPASREGGTDVDWAMVRGSSEARDVMSQDGDCTAKEEGGLALFRAGKATSLPFTCGVRGAAWIDESTFVVSIGSESGAILTTFTPPASNQDR
ncbi:hypothetical protein [Salinibacterium sp. ZJ450]|uniref:hypothetical protein n=1 Tax=Salinibacterium sp. ZJ450 TaxID=2708338 RepID=UPI0014246282|nr:hypothetical protein [Salinibacterium sp. ZJ450]